jgi:hypothetical protein
MSPPNLRASIGENSCADANDPPPARPVDRRVPDAPKNPAGRLRKCATSCRVGPGRSRAMFVCTFARFAARSIACPNDL